MRSQKAAPKPEVIERWAKALDARKLGATYAVIAKQLGYADPSGAWQAVQDALQRTLQESADDLRRIEIERLDQWLLSLGKKIQAGDPRSIDTALKIQERRSRYLGLDAPNKLELSGSTGVVIQYLTDDSVQATPSSPSDPQ